MRRKQIYVDPQQEEQLKQLAYRRKLPVSHLIREAIAEYLVEQETPHLARPEDHPLWSIVGIVADSGAPSDGSVNLDTELYGRSPHGAAG